MTPDLGTGSLIAGRYEVGEVLGRGGMGQVRAGRDLRLDRDVAIKFLSPDVASRPSSRVRFEAEARAAARLNHPNIVLVYDSGEHQGVPFLVMERLPGRTLADEMADGRLTAERARRVGLDVLAALAAAHGAGIVHRDVKPGNVLLCPDGAAKVADFGIAKSVDDVDLTTTGMLLGTPAYLSPEQVAGEAATAASDIYSVGVLLYEALAGRKPFDASSPLPLAHAIQNDDPVPLKALRPDVPDDLAAAIAAAMEKAPQRRFPSAEAMAAAIGGGQSAPPPSGTEPISPTERFGTRTRRIAAAEPSHAGSGRLRAVATRQRRDVLVLIGVFVVALLVAIALAGRDGSSPDQRITPTTAAPGAAVASDLDRALQRLEQAVQP